MLKELNIKYTLAWIGIILFRFLPFRAPNVEPLLAVVMPFSTRIGYVGSFLFAASSIVVYDAFTSGWGMWTLITMLAYGALGLGSRAFFAHRTPSALNFVGFSIISTIFYDAVTGLTVGPLFFHQSLMVAIVGQIPFTILHLAGSVLFAVLLSPVVYRWVNSAEVVTVQKVADGSLYGC